MPDIKKIFMVNRKSILLIGILLTLCFINIVLLLNILNPEFEVKNNSRYFKITEVSDASVKKLISCINTMNSNYPKVLKDSKKVHRLRIQLVDNDDKLIKLSHFEGRIWSTSAKLEKNGSTALIKFYINRAMQQTFSRKETQLYLNHMFFYFLSNQFQKNNYKTCLNKLSPQPEQYTNMPIKIELIK